MENKTYNIQVTQDGFLELEWHSKEYEGWLHGDSFAKVKIRSLEIKAGEEKYLPKAFCLSFDQLKGILQFFNVPAILEDFHSKENGEWLKELIDAGIISYLEVEDQIK